MTRLAVFFTSFVFLLVISAGEAEARRFGGGGSKGTFSRQITPSKAPSQVSRPAASPKKPVTNTGRSGFGGMLMGLAAGGLLAAMFMGGAFEGIQLFDIILIVLIGGGIMMFMRSRRMQAAHQPEPAFNNGHSSNQEPVTHTPESTDKDNDIKSLDDKGEIIYGAPDWFDEKAFLEGAKSHFMAIQKAWDANDLTTIQEYVTPQLYKFLQEERKAQVDQVETQVRKLAVEVTNIQQLPSNIVELAIMFHGIINEGGPTDSSFCEIWHLVRDMNQENAPWLIQGIEEVET